MSPKESHRVTQSWIVVEKAAKKLKKRKGRVGGLI
jgi:hypothetical protein